jgi:protein-disulfide isomerase
MTTGQLIPPVAESDHVSGPDDAPLTLVEYGDFECPHCGRAYPILKSIKQQLGARLRVVFRHFPLTETHPHAAHAAETAESAATQGKFWEMHDALFEHQEALDDDALIAYADELGLDATRVARDLESGTYAPRVRANFRSGVRSGVNGTPTFFVNGDRWDGPWFDEVEFLRTLREAADEAESAARA